MSKEIKKLSPKYIVFKREDLTKKFEITFLDEKFYDEYCKKDTLKYFVMKLDDEFNMNEFTEKLLDYYIKEKLSINISGSDLSLIILNSISDKEKLKEKK